MVSIVCLLFCIGCEIPNHCNYWTKGLSPRAKIVFKDIDGDNRAWRYRDLSHYYRLLECDLALAGKVIDCKKVQNPGFDVDSRPRYKAKQLYKFTIVPLKNEVVYDRYNVFPDKSKSHEHSITVFSLDGNIKYGFYFPWGISLLRRNSKDYLKPKKGLIYTLFLKKLPGKNNYFCPRIGGNMSEVSPNKLASKYYYSNYDKFLSSEGNIFDWGKPSNGLQLSICPILTYLQTDFGGDYEFENYAPQRFSWQTLSKEYSNGKTKIKLTVPAIEGTANGIPFWHGSISTPVLTLDKLMRQFGFNKLGDNI